MKTFSFAIILAGLISSTTYAAVFSKELVVNCDIGSTMRVNGSNMGQLIKTDNVQLTFPRQESETIEHQFGGSTTLRYGAGLASTQQTVKVLDKNGHAVQKQVSISVEVTRLEGQKKQARFDVTSFNPFTERSETKTGTIVRHALDGFIYLEILNNHPDFNDLRVQGNIQNYIFCNFRDNFDEVF